MKQASTFLLLSIIFLMLVYFAPFHTASAITPPVGTDFDHIVIIAMENQPYAYVLGSGTGNSSAPFLAQLLQYSTTFTHYYGYGANGRASGSCSAACYVSLTTAMNQGDGISDHYCDTFFRLLPRAYLVSAEHHHFAEHGWTHLASLLRTQWINTVSSLCRPFSVSCFFEHLQQCQRFFQQYRFHD
jgi:hypothetical protein